MNTKEKTKKDFDAVRMMREIRDKIDKETAGMNFEELQNYFKRSQLKNRKRAERQ